MKLLEILSESIEAGNFGSATNSLKSNITTYLHTLAIATDIMKDKVAEDNMRIGRLMAGKQKANWVNEHYLSSRQFGSFGLQQAAMELAKRAKDPKARAVFANMARIKYSASKEFSKTGIFEQVGDYFEELAPMSKDPAMSRLLNQVRIARNKLEQATHPLPEDGAGRSAPKPKAPKNELAGQQNAQAEESFRQVVQSLPKHVQKEVLSQTARLGPAEKMAFLRKFM